MVQQLSVFASEAGCRWEALVAHQLRSPLAALSMKLCSKDGVVVDELKSDVKNILRLLDQLQLSGSCDHAWSERSQFSLRDLAGEETAMLSPLAVQKGQTLSLRSFGCRDRLVLGDKVLIGEAISNLLTNAIKYSPRDTRIDLVVLNGTDLCLFDRGPGIDDREADRIFDPFVRGQRTRDQNGSGLGLYLVRKIAVSNGGSVSYARRTGGGSLFHLRLKSAPI